MNLLTWALLFTWFMNLVVSLFFLDVLHFALCLIIINYTLDVIRSKFYCNSSHGNSIISLRFLVDDVNHMKITWRVHVKYVLHKSYTECWFMMYFFHECNVQYTIIIRISNSQKIANLKKIYNHKLNSL